jgi:hypothetical protein
MSTPSSTSSSKGGALQDTTSAAYAQTHVKHRQYTYKTRPKPCPPVCPRLTAHHRTRTDLARKGLHPPTLLKFNHATLIAVKLGQLVPTPCLVARKLDFTLTLKPKPQHTRDASRLDKCPAHLLPAWRCAGLPEPPSRLNRSPCCELLLPPACCRASSRCPALACSSQTDGHARTCCSPAFQCTSGKKGNSH